MTLSLHLKIAGTMLLVLAALHVFFPERLRWKEELARLSLVNRQIFIVHCLFIVLLLVMFGALALFFTKALLEPTALGKVVSSGIASFWALRLLAQLFVYDPRIWRGNRTYTAAHVGFTLMWAYYAAVFGWTAWRQFA